MALGIEMMLGNLIGMKPEEIKAAAEFTMKTISQAASDMAEIKVRIANIELYLMEKEMNNGNRKRIANGSDNNSSIGATD